MEIKDLSFFFNDDEKMVEQKAKNFIKNIQSISLVGISLLLPEYTSALAARQQKLNEDQNKNSKEEFTWQTPIVGEFMQNEIFTFINYD